ncbi:MAG: hypothetical protein RBS28_12560 [Rhodocyclaceae bacterium]|jgi:hypothetical protein|nr:hypothetical protein [Rhodocyclaceae bacterium]
MSAYIIGNVLGRLVASYALVWLVMFIGTRLRWRNAFRNTHRWFGILSIGVIFLIGVAISVSKTAT